MGGQKLCRCLLSLPASVAVRAAGHTQEPLIELPDFAELEQAFLLPLRPQPPPPSLLLTPPETALIEKLLMSLGCLWQGGILEALLRLLAT